MNKHCGMDGGVFFVRLWMWMCLFNLQSHALWSWRFFWDSTMVDLGCAQPPRALLTGPGSALFCPEDSCTALFVLPCLLIGLACLRRARVLIVSHRNWLAISWEDCVLVERENKINKESQEPKVALKMSRERLQRKQASIWQLQTDKKYRKYEQNAHLSSVISLCGFCSDFLILTGPELVE